MSATHVKVYTVNGATTSSASSLPDWLTRKRVSKKGKRAVREHFEGTIELIQGFEFPEASNRVKTTRDGHHVVATGTYKPQMRVWDLDQLSLKFERHSDAENVDFITLSDDWTKSIHLQNDRTIELHTQGGLHYRTRIPRFGRSLAYHFPSCDAFFSAAGNEIYRLNLEQGRFLNPLVLQTDSDDGGNIPGVNVIDINPAHQLLAFGVEGNGTVQFWDPRSRSKAGLLKLPTSRLMPTGMLPGLDAKGTLPNTILSVTAIASRPDGLSYAIGTSTGHILLYDIRAARPFALKDQGYGLPLKNVAWIEGGSRMAGDGLVLSADRKVIKIWDRNAPSANFVSITPAADLNHVHHVPGSGLLMLANEGIQMTTYYVPQLGPAPRWASFLENITEEMEDQTTRTAYEDYKFVQRSELHILGLHHLLGTAALKPYMHGYFMSLKLYDAARVIANPFAYAEHRDKLVREKMEKLAEGRIRTKEVASGVKVNKALAEKIQREEERQRRKEERQKKRRDERADVAMEIEETPEADTDTKPTLLNDPRFKRLFEDPEFAVDEESREYALMNPSAVTQRQTWKDGRPTRTKTAVEEEEEESDKPSSDGLGESSSNESGHESGSDSSDAGELNKFDPRARPGQKNPRAQEAYARNRERNRLANISLVPARPQMNARGSSRASDKNATFGERRTTRPDDREGRQSDGFGRVENGGMETSWVPSAQSAPGVDERINTPRKKEKRKGVETFAAGFERGGEGISAELSESQRKGRTQRRKGVRSGSKNVFRRMG